MGLRRRPAALALAGCTLLLCAAAATGQADSPALAPAAPELIGMGLAGVLARLGPPEEVFSARGATEAQDDVVFYYAPQHLYLFWFQNRVWQLRYDRRHEGTPFAVRMGSSPAQVKAALGEPLRELEDCVVYQLEDRGYPVRLRLYFEEDRLVDLYCYRADL